MLKKITLWFNSHRWLKDFEEGLPLIGKPEAKWKFYYNIQKALESLPTYISPKSKISRTAEYSGQVIIESGVQILPGVFIEGPAYIGRNALVGNCSLVRAGSFISNGAIIGNHCYCTASVLGPKAGAFHFCGISRSLLERNSRVSAFVVTATTRPDLKPITNYLPDKKISKLIKRGCIIGENTFVGPYVFIAPGVAIGKNCLIGSSAHVTSDIVDQTRLDPVFKIKVRENKISTAKAPQPPSISFKEKK